MRLIQPGTVNSSAKSTKIRKALEESKPVWLVNRSEKSEQTNGAKAVIYLSLKDDNGSTINANLPDTWLPILITQEIPASVLLKSRDFWSYVSKGWLVMISPKAARELLNSAESKDEQERLKVRERGDRKAAKSGPTKGTRPSSGQTADDTWHPDDDRNAKEDDEPEDKVQNRVKAICGRLAAGQMQSGSAIGELKSLTLSSEELGYILGNAHVRGQDGKTDTRVCDWAMDKLQNKAERSAAKRGGLVLPVPGEKKLKKKKV